MENGDNLTNNPQPKTKYMTNAQMRDKIIATGVKNLNAYGYPNCNADNILTDDIYKEFFKSMLKDNLGNGDSIDVVINQLLEQLEK